MAQITWQPAWIADEFFNEGNPCEAKIVAAAIEENKGKEELIIHVANKHHEAKMSIWGDNKRHFAQAIGDGRSFDSDKLIGMKCKVSQTLKDGKKVKSVQLLA